MYEIEFKELPKSTKKNMLCLVFAANQKPDHGLLDIALDYMTATHKFPILMPKLSKVTPAKLIPVQLPKSPM